MSLLELVVNPNSGRNILPDCCTPETFADVRAFHRTLPGYQPTPLVALPDLAKEVGVKGVYIKDESKRFGLNAFKALGASYAIHKLFPDGNVGLTVTATDGNHGRGVAALIDACARYYEATGRRISFEDGVNDTPEHARLLAKHARRVCAHVNLIPLNHVEERAFRPSTPEHLKAFIRILEHAGVNVTVRRKLGSDVDASCGQLRKKVADHRA